MSLCTHIAPSSLLGISQALDHCAWKIEEFAIDNEISPAVLEEIIRSRDLCNTIFSNFLSTQGSISSDDKKYIRDKFFRLNEKIRVLVPVEPKVTHVSFAPKAPQVEKEDQAVIREMIQLLTENNKVNFKKAMEALPVPTQHEIYRKHWEMMGSPKKTSHDGHLRSIAHSDFGRVSLLGLDSRCDVAPEKKIQTLQAFMETL